MYKKKKGGGRKIQPESVQNSERLVKSVASARGCCCDPCQWVLGRQPATMLHGLSSVQSAVTSVQGRANALPFEGINGGTTHKQLWEVTSRSEGTASSTPLTVCKKEGLEEQPASSLLY